MKVEIFFSGCLSRQVSCLDLADKGLKNLKYPTGKQESCTCIQQENGDIMKQAVLKQTGGACHCGCTGGSNSAGG